MGLHPCFCITLQTGTKFIALIQMIESVVCLVFLFQIGWRGSDLMIACFTLFAFFFLQCILYWGAQDCSVKKCLAWLVTQTILLVSEIVGGSLFISKSEVSLGELALEYKEGVVGVILQLYFYIAVLAYTNQSREFKNGRELNSNDA